MCYKFCKEFVIKLKDGKKINAKTPKISYARQLAKYYNELIKEGVEIDFYKRANPKQVEEDLRWKMSEFKKGRRHEFILFYNEKIIGAFLLYRFEGPTEHHAFIVGSLSKKFRNKGLSYLVSKKLIEIAKKERIIKIISGEAFATNKGAIALCKKLGFKEVARLPKRHFYKGKYVDEAIMDLNLK